MRNKPFSFHDIYLKPLLGFTLLLVLAGVFAYKNLKTGLFPDITFPKIKVIADAGQQPVEKMMTTVTVPLENLLKRTEGLDYVRSTTARGSCEISVFLNWDTDIDKAKSQIDALVNAAAQGDLPAGVQITVEKMNPSSLAVMGYSLEGKRSLVELKRIATLQIKPFLAATPGVANVGVIGGKNKEYQVLLKPERLSILGITPQTVGNIINQSNLLLSNGYTTDYGRLYLTLTDNAVDSREELENLVIQNTPQRTVRLRDIAEVVVGEEKEYVKINANGQDVPLIAVMKQPKANLLEVSDLLQKRALEIEKTLPKDVHLRPFYVQGDFVRDSIKSIEDVLWMGLLLAILVVILFLRSLTSSLVVLLTIPVTLALTLLTLYCVGYTFNIMTLGAIAAAIGLMIDDAVIVVEQLHRSQEDHPTRRLRHVVRVAMQYLFPAMVASSLSTIVIFIPFLAMSGVAGAYFKVLAMTMIIALTASFFASWLSLPVLYVFLGNLFHKKAKKTTKPVTQSTNQPIKNHKWASWVIRHWWVSFLLVGALVWVLATIPNKLESGFLPEMDEGTIVLDFKSPPGTSLEETERLLARVDDVLHTTPEVESFSRRTGTQMGFFITEPNVGDFLIQLKKDRTKKTEDVSSEIRAGVEAVCPQLEVDFGQVMGDQLGDLMESVQPIEVKIYGSDRLKLEEISQEVAEIIEKVPGTADVFDGIVVAGPEVNVQPDVAKLAQLGVTPTDFQFQLQTGLEGNVVSTLLEHEQQVNIRLLLKKSENQGVDGLRHDNIFLPDGKYKPLSTVANIEIGAGVAEVNRENQRLLGAVTARLENRDLGSTLKEIQQKIGAELHLPEGYHLEYGGSYAQQQRAFKELLFVLGAASTLVFIVLLVFFREFLVSLLIILLGLLGSAGCILALWWTGTPLNVGSYTGIIMIIGIIGENAIFTVQQYKDALKTLPKTDAIVFAIGARLRPKLMTALGAIIALFPLAMGIGTGAQMHQPLAIAVIGGLLVALPLLLVVLPTILKRMR
jgi:heavy metal efflux system protein